MSGSSERSVVITGTSTGIGRATALRLAEHGWRVFAGVRRLEDGEELAREGGARIAPLLLEVTDAGSIERAAKEVERAAGGLTALVNNAGISVGGPVELVETAGLQRQFEVNVFGPMALTRALLPLLRRARGRIVNVSSGAGRASMPMLGVYCASKHALEALSDALRLELRGAGVDVVLVEPGLIRTPFVDKGRSEAEQLRETWSPEQRAYYEPRLASYLDQIRRLERLASKPELVAGVIERALTARSPAPRYTAGADVKLLLGLRWLLPDRLHDRLLATMTGF